MLSVAINQGAILSRVAFTFGLIFALILLFAPITSGANTEQVGDNIIKECKEKCSNTGLTPGLDYSDPLLVYETDKSTRDLDTLYIEKGRDTEFWSYRDIALAEDKETPLVDIHEIGLATYMLEVGLEFCIVYEECYEIRDVDHTEKLLMVRSLNIKGEKEAK